MGAVGVFAVRFHLLGVHEDHARSVAGAAVAAQNFLHFEIAPFNLRNRAL